MKLITTIFVFAILLFTVSCNSGSGKQVASTPKEVASVLQDSALIIVDVRTPKEFSEEHLKGAINYPIESFSDSISLLSATSPILVVCRSGNKSSKASKLLRESGFNRVYDGGKWQNVEEIIRDRK